MGLNPLLALSGLALGPTKTLTLEDKEDDSPKS